MLKILTAFQTSDGKTLPLVEAQAHELWLIAREDFPGTKIDANTENAIQCACEQLVKNKDKVLDVLTTKEGSRPRMRKVNGRKTKKDSNETEITRQSQKSAA